MSRKIAVASDIATCVGMVLFAALCIKNFVYTGKPRQDKTSIKVGDAMTLPSVDWKANRRSVVLLLQRNCGYCSKSAPFYNRLIPEAKSKNVRVIAAMPGPIADSKEYVAGLGLPMEEVLNANFSLLKVRGTPTVAIVDDRGIVTKVWRGYLESDKEKEVLTSL